MPHQIPVIDVGPFLAGDDGTAAAREIEVAATRVGFFQVVGHGVPTPVLDDVYAAARALSKLDPATKAHFGSPHPYRGVHLRPDGSGAVRLERFLAARFDDPASAVAAGIAPEFADFFYPNVWPTQPVGFEAACRSLFNHTQMLGAAMMRLFALALGLGVDGFDGDIEPNSSLFAVNHYPSVVGTRTVGEHPELLFHEHADGNTLTLLHQRGDYEGLQVSRLDTPGEWIPVPVRDEAFVINMGKLMSRWTNDHWPATRHRVVASADPRHQRTTLTTFHMPAVTATIAPLAPFCDADGPHYEPLTAYDSEKASIREYALPQGDALLLATDVVDFAARTS